MKTTLTVPILVAASCILAFVPGTGQSAQFNMSFDLATPRILSITSAPAGHIPAIDLQFYYDSKGRLLCGNESTVDTNAVSGQATLAKKAHGAIAYNVSARGTVMKSLNLTLKGILGSNSASCTLQNGKLRLSATNLQATVSFVSPVVAQFTLVSQIDSKGKITGSGSIVSGFDNESTNSGVLSGKQSKSQLTWQLKQGAQRLTFLGKSTNNQFTGTLTANLAPDRGTYKPFNFPSLSSSSASTGVVVTFEGAVSQVASQGGFPTAAPGATVTVRSDLNGDGLIESNEQFTALSDTNGNYQLSGQVVSGGRAVLEVSLAGYAKELRVVDSLQAGAVVLNNITLRQLDMMTLSSGTANSSDGKLQLQGLPPQITSVQARVFDPVTETSHFPGEFADDQSNVLFSTVFVAIDARDGSGNSVTNLGGSGTLRMQVPKDTWGTLEDVVPGNNQLDEPLYYFDESSGKWVRSASNGWLEDASGAKIPEDQLSSLKNGTYAGTVYVVGPITHLSWWNCDHPLSEHACIHGVVVDTNGTPIAGAGVEVKGLTYNGLTSPKITAADGSFCADAMRSEAPGEDFDGDGNPGQTTKVGITISYGTNFYNFGPFAMPITQSTCDQGNCLDLGQLVLSDTNLLAVTICTVNGQVLYAGTGQPVSGASIFGYDEGLGLSVWELYFTNGFSSFPTTDTNGMFSLTAPVLTGLSLFAFESGLVTNHVDEFLSGTASTSGCPAGTVTIQADWWRLFDMLDNSQAEVGELFQYQGTVTAYFRSGSLIYFARIPTGASIQFPTQAGQSMSLDLYGTSGKVGTITFMATDSFGGTWQTTGVSFSGSWGD